MNILAEILFKIGSLFLSLWWLWLPVFLLAILIDLWVSYLKTKAVKAIKWILLEIKIPRDIERTPKAMEQIFAGLHGVQTSIKFLDTYWRGKIEEWFSLEIVGLNEGVSFFIRLPEQFRNLVEAQVYAQYPVAEINEVLDYLLPFEKKIPSKETDLVGVSLQLAREDFYPIRTYPQFEEREEGQRVDPLASFLEILSHLRPGESIFIQYLVRPSDDKWKEKGEEQVNKLVGKKTEKKKTFFQEIWGGLEEFLQNLSRGLSVYPKWQTKKEEKTVAQTTILSPTEKGVSEGIDMKMTKLAFKTAIRFIYLGRSEVFNRANVAALMGAFKQFNTLHLNAFKPNGKAGISARQPLKKRREFLKKKAFLERFIKRSWPSDPEKNFVLNIEELATIYHFPILTVKTPSLKRIESKKGEPPVGLPVG